MILLSQPWSTYERQLELERRRQAARHAAEVFLYSLGMIALGLLIGIILAGPVH